jgi:hypothetical protein
VNNPMLIVLLLCAAGALVRAAFKLYSRKWFPGAFIAVIGVSAIVMVVALAHALSRLDIPPGDADGAGGRIVMQVARARVDDTLFWALGFFLSAVGLVECPDALRSRWLTYPAAFALLLLMGLMLVISMGQKLERVVADSSGIQVFTGACDLPPPTLPETEARGLPPSVLPEADTSELAEPETRVSWAQVDAVRLVERHVRTTVSHRSGANTLYRRELVLLDHDGNELLNIEEPLDPPDRYKLFLETLPRWTGRPVERVSVTK